VLGAVGVAEFDGGDLGDGVGAVGALERAGEEGVLAQRLGGVLGVDAAAAEVEELGDLEAVGGVDDVGGDHEVLVDEVGGVGGVGEDAADLGGGEDHVLGALGGEEGVDGVGVAQVELGCGCG
jgi:hypothetical protein